MEVKIAHLTDLGIPSLISKKDADLDIEKSGIEQLNRYSKVTVGQIQIS